jgi:perosamine synthetase
MLSITSKSGQIANGKLVAEFESRVAGLIGGVSTLSATSGTAALKAALIGIGIGIGDEVLLPSYVCSDVLSAIESVGARPVLSDVNIYGVLDYQTVSKSITSLTQAIIAVHTFGNPCNIQELRGFGVPIIEDATQSFGFKIHGMTAGQLGDVGVYSFNATKCLTTGEGGMIVTNNEALLGRAKNLPEFSTSAGKMSDLSASIGISQLKRYPVFLSRREKMAARLAHDCKSLGLMTAVDPTTKVPFRFTIRLPAEFNAVREFADAKGISVRKGVDDTLHRLLGFGDEGFPVSAQLLNTIVSIPFYPSLTLREFGRIRRLLVEMAKEFQN